MDNRGGKAQISQAMHRVDELYALPHPPDMPQEWANMLQRHEPGDGISIGCMQGRTHKEWILQASSQPMFCVAVMLKGRLRTAMQGGGTLDFGPGMFSVMSTGTPATGWDHFSAESGFSMIDIRLTPEALYKLTGQSVISLQGKLLQDCSLPSQDAFMGCAPACSDLMQVASDVLSCQLSNQTARNLYMRAKAMEALSIVLEKIAKEAEPALPTPGDRQRLLQARQLLESEYGRDWSIPALSCAVGLNEKRLQSGFKAMFGVSIHALLTQIRMDAAATLLLQGCSVTDTAYATGFSSLSHFSKVFRANKGAAPKQWVLHHAQTRQ